MKKLLFLCCFLPALPAAAQDTLALDKAMELALKNNHGILMANNQVKAAEAAAHPGNAGLLPTVSVSGSYNYSNTNTEFEIISEPQPISVDGAQSTTLQGSVGLSYTLFDGLGTLYNFRKLQASKSLSEASANITVENTLIQVVNAYYAIAQAQDNLATAQQALSISRERVNRAKAAVQFGTANKLQELNAKVDFNTDSIALVNAQLAKTTASRNLHFLLGNASAADFNVSTKVQYQADLSLEDLRAQALNNNSSLLIASQNLAVSELDIKGSQSTRYPVIGLNASYGYTGQQNDAGLISRNESIGFNGGISLNFALFDGKKRSLAIQNATIALESNQLAREQAKLQVERDILNAWSTYQARLAILNAQKTSLITAQRNFERTQQQYKLGQVTGTTFREAQLNLVRTKNALNTARYQAKLAEIDCLRIAGLLLR